MASDFEGLNQIVQNVNGVALVVFLLGLALFPGTRRYSGLCITAAGFVWGIALWFAAATFLYERGRGWELGAGIVVGVVAYLLVGRRRQGDGVGVGTIAGLAPLVFFAVVGSLIRGEYGFRSGRLFIPIGFAVLVALALGRWITPKSGRRKESMH